MSDKVAARTHRVDGRRQRLRESLRAEWIEEAEEEWRPRTGRALTAAERDRVRLRYPGRPIAG